MELRLFFLAKHQKKFKVCKFIAKYMAKKDVQNNRGIRTQIKTKLSKKMTISYIFLLETPKQL